VGLSVDRARGLVVVEDLLRWVSIRQIAADLGISVSTAYKWSARGRPWFPRSIRLHNGEPRVRRDWYEDWLAGLEA
jgi:predicted DNA-binding transcriptional regulator AlpA